MSEIDYQALREAAVAIENSGNASKIAGVSDEGHTRRWYWRCWMKLSAWRTQILMLCAELQNWKRGKSSYRTATNPVWPPNK
ncbi:Uncharacterised protein [Escherichia coli]|uniref:Uncharacterized protein n=1 Tax=Escherichia coli TaxID=562 RepID=A0A376LLT3_ECOLX|nr:Uncharacterised protein [Escherichia coli]